MWFIYIVRAADKSFYTGTTTDIDRRIREHNGKNPKGSKYTRTRRPVSLVYSEKADSRSAALKREVAIKKLSHAEKERLCSTL